jgi:hypothetical protein
VTVETAGNPLTEQDHSADSSSDDFMSVALENKRHSSHTGNTIMKSKHIGSVRLRFIQQTAEFLSDLGVNGNTSMQFCFEMIYTATFLPGVHDWLKMKSDNISHAAHDHQTCQPHQMQKHTHWMYCFEISQKKL